LLYSANRLENMILTVALCFEKCFYFKTRNELLVFKVYNEIEFKNPSVLF